MTQKSTFLPQELIRRKRDGEALSDMDIEAFVAGLTDGSISDSQAAAFAMAVYFKGLENDEQVTLTRAMMRSGDQLSWPKGAPVVDKHSTGGVGDKVSLILAPMAAAAGALVPMISGRGLGHTGGTLDKLESIPGYRATPDTQEFISVVKEVGCAIIGQTANLAPADRRLYGIRDVTATVESIPLITASILSKKTAAGLAALVMDVKWGSGAFMKTHQEATRLAKNIAHVATRCGSPTTALITDMNEVTGHSAGNAVEVLEAIEFLNGTRVDPRLRELSIALVGDMLMLTGLAATSAEGQVKAAETLASGAAAEKFAAMVTALGGPNDLMEDPERHLDIAPVAVAVMPPKAGFVSEIDVRAVGNAVVKLGGGRTRSDQSVDHAVGLSEICGRGDEVATDQPLCLIHGRDDAIAEAVADDIRTAFTLATKAPPQTPIITSRIDGRTS